MSRAGFAYDIDAAQLSKTKVAPSSLRVSRPDDSLEVEADRVAESVSSGRRISGWSLASSGFGLIQRQSAPPSVGFGGPVPQTFSTGDILSKLAEAFLATKAGKDILRVVKGDPVVKGATDFVSTPAGIVLAGSAAVGAVSALAAAHQPLPAQIPKIPLDMLYPGLGVKITYQGPVNRPTAASLTLSFEGKALKKKSKQTESDKFQAETARMAAEQKEFRAGMHPGADDGPGPVKTPDHPRFEDWGTRRLGAVTGLGAIGHLPAADSAAPAKATYPSLQLPELGPSLKPKAPTLLDKKLELNPTPGTPNPEADEKKREEIPVQRKAKTSAEVSADFADVDAVLRSTGRPLDRETRRFMESKIGFDFGRVRIHSDTRAAASAKAMGALAYTVGTNVVFGAGCYAPNTDEGRRLLAHELTHTIQQQRKAPVAAPPIRSKALRMGAGAGGKNGEPRYWSSGETQPRKSLVPIDRFASGLRREQQRRERSILSKGPVRFRVPTTADMKSLFTGGNVPESVLKAHLELILRRMAWDGRLKTTDSIPDVMKKIFPSAGAFDEAAYEDAVDVTNRSEVYQNILDAEAKVTSADKPKLKTVMEDAAKLIDDCIIDDENLGSVFGTKKATAKAIYVQAKAALERAISHMDTSITIDYNLDDPETSVGGWATFSDQHVHFTARVAKITNADAAKVTIIHESAHLADPLVDDKGYYGTAGFEGLTEHQKVTNAAHYEEIPMRHLGKSKYKGQDNKWMVFKPGMSPKGTETFGEKAKRKASEYIRKAWETSVHVHEFIRDVRVKELGGNKASFNAHRARILEISKLMHLTVHEQPAATASINQVDVVTVEGVAHGTSAIYSSVDAQPAPLTLRMPKFESSKPDHPSIMGQKLELQPIPGLGTNSPGDAGFAGLSEDAAAAKMIENAIKSYPVLLGDPAEDKKLLAWLVANNEKAL